MIQKNEKNDDIIDGLMPKEAFERRFSFIDNETLKKNIAIAFEYIVFLIDAASKESHKPLIRSSLYKDAVVYTGTIVEACLCYVLMEYISKKKTKKAKILNLVWRTESEGTIHKFNSKKRIRYIIESLKYNDIKKNPDFMEVNRVCRKAKIISEKEFELVEDIRIARNKIHVSGLKEIDNSYSKEKLEAIFDKANKIIRKVEKKLLKINIAKE